MTLPDCIAFLMARGVSRNSAGAMIYGKWVKQYGEEMVLDAFEAARRFDRENQRTGGLNDPIPWLVAALRARETPPIIGDWCQFCLGYPSYEECPECGRQPEIKRRDEGGMHSTQDLVSNIMRRIR